MSTKSFLFFCLINLLFLASAFNIYATNSNTNLEKLAESDSWNALLFTNDQHKIVDENTYFTNTPIDPLAELQALCNNISIKNIEKYPARYYYIKENTTLDVPLEKSEKISNYLNSLSADSVSIIYASSYLGSPMSYFGHTFIRFNKSDNLYFSQTLGFAAEVPQEIGALSMMLKGATGNLNGVYQFSPFFVIAEKYLRTQQRYLIEHKLQLNDYQIKLLALIALEIIENNQNYNFFTNNCTSELDFLLAAVIPDFNSRNRVFNVVLPYDLIDKISRDKLIQETTYYHPDIYKIQYVYSDLSLSDKYFYNLLLKNRNKKRLLNNEYSGTELNELIFILNKHYDVLFKRYHKAPTDFNKVDTLYYTAPKMENKYNYKPIGSPLKLSYRLEIDNRNYTNLFEITPFYFNRREDRINSLEEATMEFLSVSANIYKHKITINSLDILNIESYKKFYSFFPLPSWNLYFGYNDVYNNNSTYFSLESGVGIGFGSINYLVHLVPTIVYIPGLNNYGIENRGGISIWIGRLHIGVDNHFPILFRKTSPQVFTKIYSTFSINKKFGVGVDYNINNDSVGVNAFFRF